MTGWRTRFSVGTGFTDKLQEHPPVIGSTITFRYQELTDGGVPRFPSFLRVRRDAGNTLREVAQSSSKPLFPVSKDSDMQIRHFEYIGGHSVKYWEVTVSGCDEAAANRHTEKLIASKLNKGYTKTISA